jgi:hypothetical protein
MTNASAAAAVTLNANVAFVNIIRRKEVCAFNHIQEAKKLPVSYKALESRVSLYKLFWKIKLKTAGGSKNKKEVVVVFFRSLLYACADSFFIADKFRVTTFSSIYNRFFILILRFL